MLLKLQNVALAASLINIRPVAAAWGDAELVFWSALDCGRDEKTKLTEASSLPLKMDPDATDECTSMSHVLDGFSVTGGRYQAWTDADFLKPGCKLVFYNAPPSDPDSSSSQYNCGPPDNSLDAGGMPYQEIPANAGCVSLDLPLDNFVMGQCCGDACKKYSPQETDATKPPDLPPPKRVVRDVTAVKKADLVRGKQKRKDGPVCHFVKESDVETHYLKTRRVSQDRDCRNSQTPCTITGDYTAQQGYSHSVTDVVTVSTSMSAGTPFSQISMSFGLETETTDETNESESHSRSYSFDIAPGKQGYVTFMPKVLCSQGRFEGPDCDRGLQTDENMWCIPAFLWEGASLVPDGTWGHYTHMD